MVAQNKPQQRHTSSASGPEESGSDTGAHDGSCSSTSDRTSSVVHRLSYFVDTLEDTYNSVLYNDAEFEEEIHKVINSVNPTEEESENHVKPGGYGKPASFASTTSQEDEEMTEEEDDLMTRLKETLWRSFQLLVLVILFPLLPSIVAIVMGGLLALLDGVSFGEGYLYVISDVLGLANPLTGYTPSSDASIVVDSYVSIMGILFFGIVLNTVSCFRVPEYMNHMLSKVLPHSAVVVSAVFVVVPVIIASISLVFGGFMALVETWTYGDGARYVFSNILGLGNPLTSLVPETRLGDAMDIYISSLALLFLAVFVDYISFINPIEYLQAQRKKVFQPDIASGKTFHASEDTV